MITVTKITFAKKDAKILVKLLDTVGRELAKDLEDRSDSFRFLSEENIKRFTESISYKIYSGRTEEMIIIMKEIEE